MGQLYFYSIYDIQSAICTDSKHDIELTCNRSEKSCIELNYKYNYLHINYLLFTYSTEQCLSWEANWFCT